MHDTARDHQIIAAQEAQVSELGFKHAGAVAHINQLVALPVAVEEIIFSLRLCEQRAQIVIEKQWNPVEHCAGRVRQTGRLEMPELRVG